MISARLVVITCLISLAAAVLGFTLLAVGGIGAGRYIAIAGTGAGALAVFVAFIANLFGELENDLTQQGKVR